MIRPTVVKVGGSLFDLPDLGSRLRAWLSACETSAVTLVPGGGPTTDVVRHLDRHHGLGDEASHWLALRALTLNGHFLARLLTPADPVRKCLPVVSGDPHEWPSLWTEYRLPILDAFAFATMDELRPGRLPYRWEAASDCLAARLANVINADRLILLKSASLSGPESWEQAAADGVVDPYFPAFVGQYEIQVVNLRHWRP
jgi:aspartokinase-like uncharacterized kinase